MTLAEDPTLMSPEDVLALPWIKAIKPVRDPYRRRLSKHSALEVWHIDIELPRWAIPSDLQRLWESDEDANVRGTWRKRPLVRSQDVDCPYYCGEVELSLRLRRAGFHSNWVSEWFGFPHVGCWKDVCIKRSELAERSPMVSAFDQQLRQKVASLHTGLGKRGGHPDIVAWKEGSELVFLEYKGPGDTINLKQDLWAQSILAQETGRLPYVAVMGRFVE